MTAYAKALAAYLLGNWKGAARLFGEALALKPGDGPSETLLGYIERRALTPPAGWNGVRELTSK
jgi:Flp pilus assembly protein TadD